MVGSTYGVSGNVEAGYGRVADAFRENFTSGREIGAALAIYRGALKVLDLWGGNATVRPEHHGRRTHW